MFVLDRPTFDRHPLDPTATRLRGGDRVVVNCLEQTDWERGRLGAWESWNGDPPLYPWEPELVMLVRRAGDCLALLPDPDPPGQPTAGESVLLPPDAHAALAERHEPRPDARRDEQPLRDLTPPPPTRLELLWWWFVESPWAGPGKILNWYESRGKWLTRANHAFTHLLPAIRRDVIAAHPGETDDALARLDAFCDWTFAAHDAPAPGSFAPADPAETVTLYLDADGFPEWPALTVEGGGIVIGGWAYRPAGGSG